VPGSPSLGRSRPTEVLTGPGFGATAPDLMDLATADIATRWAQVPLGRKRALIDRLVALSVLPVENRWHTEPRAALDGRRCKASPERPCGCQRFDPARIRITWRALA